MSDDPIRPTDEKERVSRLSTATAPSQTDDDVVREYEARYTEPRNVKAKPRSYSASNISDDERLWAAVAHGSIWFTMLGGLFTTGFVVPMSIFIPLAIYFMYRKRSDYVAFHALQSFVLQLIGTVGVLALLIVGGAAWVVGMILALLAVFVLAGVILVPLWALVGIALMLTVFLTPLATLVLGTIATVETYNRRDYRYPFIARLIDRQLAGGFLNTM
jgi:uncharacterized Tic20 family protein